MLDRRAPPEDDREFAVGLLLLRFVLAPWGVGVVACWGIGGGGGGMDPDAVTAAASSVELETPLVKETGRIRGVEASWREGAGSWEWAPEGWPWGAAAPPVGTDETLRPNPCICSLIRSE